MYNLNVNVNSSPAQGGAVVASDTSAIPTTTTTTTTATTMTLFGTTIVPPQASSGLLNVATATVAAAEATPRTPEIVNSLIAMTNPFDGYNTANSNQPRERAYSSSSGEPSPPSIQHTCSQLIKEGLKLTLQTKRRAHGLVDENKKRTRKEDGSADDEEDDESSNSKSNGGHLTPEDEERRRRRRERNKIAATKCRLKKREKTVILVQESETLESQNHELKSQIQELETQRRRLVDMLNLHGPTCIKQTGHPEPAYQQYTEQSQLPLPSYQENFIPGSLNQQSNNPSDCSILTDYNSVKVEGFEAVAQDFFRQANSYGPTTTTATTTGTSVINDATGCVV